MDKIFVEAFRRKFARRATVLDIGGFKPKSDPKASWFGDVNLCLPGETWPYSNEKPMNALAQINLLDFDFIPPGLEGIELITVYISSNALPNNSIKGDGWLIRTYKHIGDLTTIDKPVIESDLKILPMRSRIVTEDYPCWEDVPIDVPEDIEEDYYELFTNIDGFKFGGWPSLIQSEIYWAPFNKHESIPEYIFQIDSCEKANWSWGDAGVGYFGRGTAPGKQDDWAIEWQCY